MAKTVNYTPEQVERMKAVYSAAESDADRKAAVKALATEFGKHTRSIVAKLSHLKIYQAPTRQTKTGGEVVTKEKLADRIAAFVGINPETTGLAKANKTALRALVKFCEDHQPDEAE